MKRDRELVFYLELMVNEGDASDRNFSVLARVFSVIEVLQLGADTKTRKWVKDMIHVA